MKVIVVSILSLAFISHGFSQDRNKLGVGLYGGPVFAKVNGPDLFPGDYKYKSGYELELAFRYYQNNSLFYETTFGFTRAGYIHTYKSILFFIDDAVENSYFGFKDRYHQDYIHNEWAVGYSFGNKLEFVIKAGIFWAYMLQKKGILKSYVYVDENESNLTQDPLVPGYSETTSSETVPEEFYNKFDYGIMVGCGINYCISEKIQISLVPSFRNGMKNISNNDATTLDQKYYNRIFSIRAGLTFMF